MRVCFLFFMCICTTCIIEVKESFDKSKTLYMGYHDELEETKEHLRQIQVIVALRRRH